MTTALREPRLRRFRTIGAKAKLSDLVPGMVFYIVTPWHDAITLMYEERGKSVDIDNATFLIVSKETYNYDAENEWKKNRHKMLLMFSTGVIGTWSVDDISDMNNFIRVL